MFVELMENNIFIIKYSKGFDIMQIFPMRYITTKRYLIGKLYQIVSKTLIHWRNSCFFTQYTI